MTDHTYREQAPKPPPPPGPTTRERLSKWWTTTGRWAFFDPTLPSFLRGWCVALLVIGFIAALVVALVRGANWWDARDHAAQIFRSPCVNADVTHGYKQATAPDGTPVMVPTSWCVHTKPGREGEAP